MGLSFRDWYPVGAQLAGDGADFRVWAPLRKSVGVVIRESEYLLEKDGEGFFGGHVAGVRDGDEYRFRLDAEELVPDPASRFQPAGPHGASQIVDPTRFEWSDGGWRGIAIEGQVIYEMHVGTFTAAGTWESAMAELPGLADLGVTVVEIMPIADFPGEFGWGYDGVNLFAPTRLYGRPDDFRRFVNRAHELRLSVILDVVYNHLGPDGNYLAKISPFYFTKKRTTDWGSAINFDDERSEPVREYFAANAAYWVKEYHLDGLRLDATQNIYDDSAEHILARLTRAARAAAGNRSIIVVGENEPQNVKLIRGVEEGGFGLDGLWNDDFHHSAMVAATGKKEAYYMDYMGSPQEFVSGLKYGFLYQGQFYSWQKKARGTPTYGTKAAAMITFVQNHDQVANSARGLRLHELTTMGRYKALTAVMLLAPGTPMLFQGQEFASSAPFLFFADHEADLAKTIREGRVKFLSQWRSLARREFEFADPGSRETFVKCKLDHTEREKHAEMYALHRDLLKLRRTDREFSAQDRKMDGAVLGAEAFCVRFFSDDFQSDKLLLVNLGMDLRLNPAPEPLLAPVENCRWDILWSSEDPRYGGSGTPAFETNESWTIPGHAAVVLAPASIPGREKRKAVTR